MAKMIINTKKIIRTGIGYDVHAFDKTKETESILIGATRIPYQYPIKAHSDGDVLLHALVDSILGSIGHGDIGEHFPASNKKYKNMNSEIFLEFALKQLNKVNAKINNIDIIIICEKPNFKNYKTKIITKLAKLMKIDKGLINVKATTTEKLGALGRAEGIAVQSLITIRL